MITRTPDTRGLVAYRARVTGEKRAAILDAAVGKFLEGGYAGTSLEAIARTAEVSTGTLFKHFPTKAALFGAIMARVWENEPGAEGTVPPPGDPRAGLMMIGRDYARLLRAPNVEALFRVVIAEAPRFPELGRELYERGKAPYLARLEAYLRSEASVGQLQLAGKATSRATREFLGMINDQIFWPRFLVIDLVIGDGAVERVLSSATDTFLARYHGPVTRL